MNAEQIAALQPGPELDRLVHEHIFAKSGRRKAWSTTSAALEIVDHLPVVVGRRPAGDPGYATRPFWAGTVEHVPDQLGQGDRYTTTTRVFSTTAPLALCKAGLIEAFRRRR